jgi:excisionase family DNA binding protein
MDHSTLFFAAFAGLPEILRAKDLAKALQISVKTIYAYAQRGLIPYIRIESNVRFAKREILAWLEERHYRP